MSGTSIIKLIILLLVSIDGYSFSPPRIIHCETNDECRNVNCTGNITSQGNLTVTFSHSGSCSEPAQINVTTFDTVELDSGGIATVTQSIRVTDCFWIPQNKRSGSISLSSPSWNGGTYLEFYVHSRTSASGVVNIEFEIVNGSYGEFSNIEPSSDPHCRKPGMCSIVICY